MTNEDALVRIVELVRARNKKDWDTVGGITADEGKGKTDLLIKFGLLYEGFTLEQISHPSKEDLERIGQFFRNNMLYTQNAQEIEKVIEHSPQYAFVGVDEGMMILYKYEHGTKKQRKLNKYFATCRKGHNNAVWFCMQDFNDFSKFFRNRRILLWIHVVDRGSAILMKRSSNPVAEDKWDMDRFSELYDLSNEFVEDLERVFRDKKYKNYVCILFWNRLPKSIRDLYDKVRTEIKEQYGEPESEEDQESKLEARLRTWIIRWYKLAKAVSEKFGLTQKEIADFLDEGATNQNVYSWYEAAKKLLK